MIRYKIVNLKYDVMEHIITVTEAISGEYKTNIARASSPNGTKSLDIVTSIINDKIVSRFMISVYRKGDNTMMEKFDNIYDAIELYNHIKK